MKCPYCQAAVQVPTAEEAVSAGASAASLPTPDSGPLPVPPPRPTPPAMPGAAAKVASPDDWGALPSSPPPPAYSLPPPSPEPEPEAFPPSLPGSSARGGRDRPRPARPEKPAKGKGTDKTAEDVLAAGWLSVRRGLFWVQFALLWLSLIGFIGFGKIVYTRAVGPLPSGDGWIQIEGYVNTNDPNAVRMSKTDEMNLALYGLPVCIAVVALVFGRLIAGSAPRSSGARGLFACSALFGLVGFGSMLSAFLFDRLLMKEYYRYTWLAFLLLVPLAEFWFLSALTASGVALKRPKTARAVGTVGFMFALTAFVATLGWELYVEHGRPKKPDDNLMFMEQAALMLGWLLLIVVYSRAVRNVRVAAREYADTVEEASA